MEHGLAHGREEKEAGERTSCAAPRHPVHPSPHRRTQDGYTVYSDLPGALPVTSDEIALLRAFLADEIRTILFDDDQDW